MPKQRVSVVPKRKEMGLIKALEDKAASIKVFFDENNQLKPLKPKDKSKLLEILSTVDVDANVLVDRLLDQGVQDLEACGVVRGEKGIRIDRHHPVSEHEETFRLNLLNLDTQHSASSQKLKESLDCLMNGDSEELGNVLSAAQQAIEKTARAVRQISNDNHLMSAKEFQTSTSVPYHGRPANMRQIDNLLAQLEEPAPSRFPSFWKKANVRPSPEVRAHRVNYLYTAVVSEIETIHSAQNKQGYSERNRPADNIRKAGLEKLLVQLHYQVQRNNSDPDLQALKKPMPQQKSLR